MSDVRPTSLKVGHQTYTIFWKTEKWWKKNEEMDLAGSTNAGHESIHIRLGADGKDYGEDFLRGILLHETFHACWHLGSLDDQGEVKGDEIEEWVVCNMSQLAMAVLSDNPDVLDYLFAGSMVAGG